MTFLYGVVFLTFACIEARETPKIQIFEIRGRGDDGIELRDLGFNPKSHQRAESKLLNLFQSKKQSNTRTDVTEQLIEELKNLKGVEGNRISDDAFIYVLNNIFEASDSSSKEVFVDKTRNERLDQQQQMKNILENLMRQNLNKPKTGNRAPLNSRFGDFNEGRSHPSAENRNKKVQRSIEAS